MDKSLTALTLTLSSIENSLMENNGELTPELELSMSANTIAIEKKIDAYYSIMQRCESINDELKEKADMINQAAKNSLAIRDKLKNNLKEAMAILQTTELKGETIRFKLSSSASRLVIKNDGIVPMNFTKTVTTYVLDKEKIKTSLENGEQVDGCFLERGNTLITYPAINSKRLGE